MKTGWKLGTIDNHVAHPLDSLEEYDLACEIHNAFPLLLSLSSRTLTAEASLAEAQERIGELEHKLSQITPLTNGDLQRHIKVCEENSSLQTTISTQAAEIAKLREALTWYTNPEIYKPHPHGPAFDDRDLSFKAKAALTQPQPEGHTQS